MELFFDYIAPVRNHFITRMTFILNKTPNEMAREFARIISYYGAVVSREDYYRARRSGEPFTMNRVCRKIAYDLFMEAIERAKIDTGHRIVMNEKDMKMLGRV